MPPYLSNEITLECEITCS
uniref:Uncharacterized protein n=1 Tax=Anguilla anguilla TaxID=7936 RepID=A0A0E9QVI2_ANGAN